MSELKNNHYVITKSEYIRYLHQELQRQGLHKTPNFYSEIIKFANSPVGQQSFNKFSQINPESLGIKKSKQFNFKKAF